MAKFDEKLNGGVSRSDMAEAPDLCLKVFEERRNVGIQSNKVTTAGTQPQTKGLPGTHLVQQLQGCSGWKRFRM